MANDTNEDRKTDFLKNLYEEKLKHKEHRHVFVMQKLLFIIGLFGLGALEIKIGGPPSESGLTLKTSILLYLIPFVAAAYDVYIFAEDFKVKRIGLFVRITQIDACQDEIQWERWVSSHREEMAEKASKLLTFLALLASTSLIYFGVLNPEPGCLKFYYPDGPFWIWLAISGVFVFGVYVVYRELKKVLTQALSVYSPATVSLGEGLVKDLNGGNYSLGLQDVLKSQFFRVPPAESVVIVVKEPNRHWLIYEKRSFLLWLFLEFGKRKLYAIKGKTSLDEKREEKTEWVIEQVRA